MIYYTSDLHFGHKNILKYEHRPFYTVEGMAQGLIENWNNTVRSENDEIYVLGDVAFTNSKLTVDILNDIIKQLKGKKHLIVGNHDHFINKKDFKPYLWEEIVPYKEIKDSYKDEDHNIITKDIVLCHYPIESWNGKEHGSIHLHGHLHSHPTELALANRYNVGCDLWRYKPVTLQEIIDKENEYDPADDKFMN